MSEECFSALRDDIAQNGLLVAIKRYDGAILDGRHRYRACQELRIVPRYEDLPYGDPYDTVLAYNLRGRDLIADQRYLIWADLTERSAAWQEEQAARVDEANRKRSEAMEGNQNAAAKDENSSAAGGGTTVRDWSEVNRTSDAKAAASATGRKTVERMDPLRRARPDLAAQVKAGTLKDAQALRLMRRDGLADRIAALPPGVFRVIYADPPWKYGNEGVIDDSDAYGRASVTTPP